MAGHETTAIALSWTWRLLALYPDVEKKLHAELDEWLVGSAPTIDDLPQLTYTDAVLKESMRLYPPAWAIGREAVEDCEIGGFHVPAETQLFISQYVVHHDPRFFEDPDVFDPDRWTNGLEKQIPKYAYFPFGGGPRLCIGQSFAKMEAALLLTTIARRFRIRVPEDQRVIPQPSITLRPKQGIQIRLEER
jgi:cytochrome P450